MKSSSLFSPQSYRRTCPVMSPFKQLYGCADSDEFRDRDSFIFGKQIFVVNYHW
jgi:hypothetical protein